MNFDDYYSEANNYIENALKYYYASNGDFSNISFQTERIDQSFMKNLSKKFFKKSYENLKAVCLISNFESDYIKLLDSHIKILISLVMAEMYDEAKLAWLRARCLLCEYKYYNYDFEQNLKEKFISIVKSIKNNNKDMMLKYLHGKFDEIPKIPFCNYDSSLERWEKMNYFILIFKSNSSFLQFEEKHNLKTNLVNSTSQDLKSNQANYNLKSEITVTACATVAALSLSWFCDYPRNLNSPNLFLIVGSAVVGTRIWLVIKNIYDSVITDKSKRKHDDFKLKIIEIIAESQLALNSKNGQKFLEILSKNYDKNTSLIHVSFNKAINSWGKEVTIYGGLHFYPYKTTNILREFGFSPHYISNLWIQIFEAFMDFSNSQNEYVRGLEKTDRLILQMFLETRWTVDSDLSRLDSEMTNLSKVAKNMDDSLMYLKEKLSCSSSEQVDFFTSKFNEIRNIGIIYEFLFGFFYNGRVQYYSKEKKEEFCLEIFNDYGKDLKFNKTKITESCLRFEVLKDYMWLCSINQEIIDLVFNKV
jgi:hypothetical protein